MKGIVRIIRGETVALSFPVAQVEVKNDGTIWVRGNPILGISDPVEKKRIATLARAGKHAQIPGEYFTRLGDNPNGLWAGDDTAWESHPLKVALEKKEAEKREIAARTVRIHLSTRGWGDYSSLEWVGDITRPDSDILTECKTLLSTGYDVDKPEQSDAEILQKIAAAREAWKTAPSRKAEREAAEAEDIRQKIESGYCFSCGTWCHGDCGNYSQDPMVQFRHDLHQAQREADYGIND